MIRNETFNNTSSQRGDGGGAAESGGRSGVEYDEGNNPARECEDAGNESFNAHGESDGRLILPGHDELLVAGKKDQSEQDVSGSRTSRQLEGANIKKDSDLSWRHKKRSPETPTLELRTSLAELLRPSMVIGLLLVLSGLALELSDLQSPLVNPNHLSRIMPFMGLLLIVWGRLFPLQQATQPLPDVTELVRRNHRLAERLEQLEDKTWEVRESEEIHRTLSEALGDIVVHRNSQGMVVFKNSVFSEYFDEDTHQLPTDFQRTVSQIHESGVASCDIEIGTLKGKRWFSWTDMSVRDATTGEVGLRSVARDITAHKTSEREIMSALDQAGLANDAKSQFLAMVSHEIRTPLHGISGMVGLLKDTPLAPDQANYVDAISSSGQTLLSLIEDLLDTARIENGTLAIDPAPTDLEELVEGVAELLAPAARKKHLDIATYVSAEIAKNVVLDSGRLRQVLINLAGNAVKFTKAGGLCIEVTCDASREPQTGTVSLGFHVIDSGPGLSKSDQVRVFGEFVQTDEGAMREFGGAGLGLSISQNIVALMGGEIAITSQLGKGTVFQFAIEAERCEFEETRLSQQPLHKKNLALVLQRNPARSALVRTMRSMGMSVSTFDTMEAFQLTLNEHPEFDCLIAELENHSQAELSTLRNLANGQFRLISIGNAAATRARQQEMNLDGWLTWPARKSTLTQVLSGTAPTKRLARKQPMPTLLQQPALSILLVEDNEINSLLARSMLAKLGHDVVQVEDGEAAIAEMFRRTFDAVLMDLHMPKKDGLTALKEIRQQTGDKARIPVFILSADGQPKIKAEAMQAGASEFLTKPLEFETVAKLLEQHVLSGYLQSG